MSDKPLFQNTDAQEAEYAPEELPEGTRGDALADIEEGEDARGSILTDNNIVVPAAAAGLGSGAGSTGATGATGTAAGVGPAVGAAALAEETEDDDLDAAERGSRTTGD
jgi:hypothetical protein